MESNTTSFLDPNKIQIDHRSVADMILFVKKLAQLVPFYNRNNEIDGNFETLFESDESFLIAEIAKFPVDEIGNKRLNLITQFDQAQTKEQKAKLFKSYLTLINQLFNNINNWYQAAKKNNLSIESSPIEKELEFAITNKLAPLFITYKNSYSIYRKHLSDKHDSHPTLEKLNDFVWQAKKYDKKKLDPMLSIKGEHIDSSIKKLILISTELFQVTYNLTLKALVLLEKSIHEKSNHKPHVGLIFSFLHLFKFVQNDINSFTQKHLDFYYKHILKQELLTPKPLRTYACFGIDQNSDELLLGDENYLVAGQYTNGKSIRFKLDDELRLNNVKLSSLSTIYASRNPLFDYHSKYQLVSAIHHKIVARDHNELNQFNQKETSFSALGSEQDFLTENEKTMETAEVGFMLSSSILKLATSKRDVQLAFSFTMASINYLSNLIMDISTHTDLNEEEVFNKVFSASFDIFYTIEDGWYKIDQYQILAPKDWTTGQIKINFHLNKLQPAFRNFEPSIHKVNIESSHPALKFILNQNNFYNAYSFISVLELERIDIQVNVKDLKQFKIFREGQLIDSNSAFDLFGPIPRYGAKAYIACEEMFNKQLLEFGIDWNFENIPPGCKSLKDYYAAYGQKIDETSYQVKFSALSDFNYKKHQSQDLVFNLFSLNEKNELSKNRSIQCQNLNPLKILPNYDLDLNEITQFNPDIQTGILELELLSPEIGFGFDLFPKLQAKQLADEYSNKKKQDQTLNEPFAPKIDQLRLCYKAETTLYFNEKDQRANEIIAKNTLHQISPYGVNATFSGQGVSKKTLVYEFTNQGELIIGLDCEQAFSGLNILFEIVKQQNTDYQFSQKIEWHYSSNSGWNQMNQENILYDHTFNLMRTGIISFRFPTDFMPNDKILAGNLFYIKACSKDKVDQFSLIKSIQTNAIGITEIVPEGDTERKSTLKKGSVEGFEKKVPKILSVVQPFKVHQELNKETQLQFYTRISELLRHKKRPVTNWEFEKFILAQFEWISHVKCFTVNKNNKINLHLMCVKHIESHQNIEEIKLSSAEMNQVKSYLNSYISPFVNLEIINPVFEDLWIKCKLRFKNISNGKGIEKFNKEFFDFVCKWKGSTKENRIGIPSKIKKYDLIKFINSRDYIHFVTAISIIHLKKTNEGKINVYDSAVTNDENEFIQSGTNQSVIIPRNRHKIDLLTKDEYHPAQETNYSELAISESFLIVAKQSQKEIKNMYQEDPEENNFDNLQFILTI